MAAHRYDQCVPQGDHGLAPPPQELRFCRSSDGVRIAYARHGSGPPLVIATCWLSHLQYDWQSPVWRHFLSDLGEIATVVRYDERGHGLSDWDVDDYGLEARIADIEAVVDDAGLDQSAQQKFSPAPKRRLASQGVRQLPAGHRPAFVQGYQHFGFAGRQV